MPASIWQEQGPRSGGNHMLPAPARSAPPRLLRPFCMDPRSLAALRIGVAAVLLAQLLNDARDLPAFWTDSGVVPRVAMLQLWQNQWLVSIHYLSGLLLVQAALLLVQILAALCLLAGFKTRAAGIISWALLTSLQNRNLVILQGGDDLLRVLLFWGVFLPWGAVSSLDACRRRDAGTRPNAVLRGATAAYTLQIAFVYLFSALLKSGAEWRHDGTAVFYALSIESISMPAGHLLLRFPRLMTGLTFETLALESLAPFVLLSPLGTARLRGVVVPVLMLLHLGFLLCLRIGLFPLINIVALVGLLPSGFWDAIPGPPRFAALRGRASGLASSRLGKLGTMIAPLPAGGSTTNDGSARSPLEPRRGRRAGALLPAAVPLILIAYIGLWNLGTLDSKRFQMPQAMQHLGVLARLDQNWSIFAPYPLRDDGWYVVPGRLRNGSVVDIYRGGAPVSWQKPASVAGTYRSYRWWKYLYNLYFASYSGFRGYYAAYLCRQWNERHTGPEQVQELEIDYVLWRVPRGQEIREMRPVSLWHASCAP